MAIKGSGSWHRWQKDIKTDILTELLFIDNYRIYMDGPITERSLFYRRTESTENTEIYIFEHELHESHG